MISNLAALYPLRVFPKLSYLLPKTQQHFDGETSPAVFLLCSSSLTKDLMGLLAEPTKVI